MITINITLKKKNLTVKTFVFHLVFLLTLSLSSYSLVGQMKTLTQQGQSTSLQTHDLKKPRDFRTAIPSARNLFSRPFHPVSQPFSIPILTSYNIIQWDDDFLPTWIEGSLDKIHTRSELPVFIYNLLDQAMKAVKGHEEINNVFLLTDQDEDHVGIIHYRFQQEALGIPVFGSEFLAHVYPDRRKWIMNGRVEKHPGHFEIPSHITNERVLVESVIDDMEQMDIKVIPWPAYMKEYIDRPSFITSKVWYKAPGENELRLCLHISAMPNPGENWDYFIDLQTGEIVDKINNICRLHPHGKEVEDSESESSRNQAKGTVEMKNSYHFNDGPFQAQGVDLLGINRTINTFRLGGLFYLIDASQPMYIHGSLPNTPRGIILTADGKKNTPYKNNFDPVDITSANNTWNARNAVSAHFNATQSYLYYKDVHQRNSINGSGGNILSFINITDEEGNDMDNAFWNGYHIYYGNGDFAFTDLAGGLDVAGHEMSHGVVQHTAGLIYRDESGALNESFCDIFGAMIERENWQIGERVVNPQFFTSGAMRDMSNPHNGGNKLGDIGFQPKHMNEKFTGTDNNGGVHINSGIVNHAYYKFATTIGLEKAEQIYYQALSQYLVKSSQFVDCRNAVIQAAMDLFGNGNEVQAAMNAFSEVGIGPGAGGNFEEELEPNPGNAFLLLSDSDLSALYLADANLSLIANPLFDIEIKSKPSITDDGQFVLFVGADKKLHLIVFDFEKGTADIEILQSDPVWRNVAVSKDGSLIAALTEPLSDKILIYSFDKEEWKEFRLFNQTTGPDAPPIFNVQYADAIEWSHDGTVLMYDALNQLTLTREAWDISFLQAWDKAGNQFGDGSIIKMFQNIPNGIDIGNPTFAKNAPHIIAFDYIDNTGLFTTDYAILGLNLERNDVGLIVENSTLGYPSYDIEDATIVYDALTTQGSPVLAQISLEEDRIHGKGNPSLAFDNGKWGVWFANGERTLTSVPFSSHSNLVLFEIYPNPTADYLHIYSNNIEANINTTDMVIEIINLMGKTIYRQVIKNAAGDTQHTAEVRNFPPGTYVLKLSQGEKMNAKLFLKH
ncbi:MAG TPA: M4 family metallopeptidase [Saprospiraceae bacterium]|nr:M4 family metallopeptidase [Saprospiraceae bacterium]